MTGFAFSLVCFAFPWISGTGGASLRGCVWVVSGRFMPFFAIFVSPAFARLVYPRARCSYKAEKTLETGIARGIIETVYFSAGEFHPPGAADRFGTVSYTHLTLPTKA